MIYHVDILEDGITVLNYDGEIPSPFNVSYNTITDIITFFNTDGYEVFQQAFNGNIELNLYPKKDVSINDYEKRYLEGHTLIFNKDNINLYTTK
jgi:hypothetical protein